MTLAELIQELTNATDGAAEDTSFRRVHPLFPQITTTRVTYLKRDGRTIEASEQMVYVEDLGGAGEAAYYEKSRVPGVVLEAERLPVIPNATPEEIKENLDAIFAGRKYWDIQIQTAEEAGMVVGMFYDTITGEATQEAYRVVKDAKGAFTAFKIKG